MQQRLAGDAARAAAAATPSFVMRGAPVRRRPPLRSTLGNRGFGQLAQSRRSAVVALDRDGAQPANRTLRRLLDARAGGNAGRVQRQGSYIPDIDGPYGPYMSDGPSTAGSAFGAQVKQDVFELNQQNVAQDHQEVLDLVYISDEDQDTMLTRDQTAVAQVDHIYPRSLGGSSSHRNAAVISADSNVYQSDNYPKELVEEFDGTRVLMGHAANAQGWFRGEHVNFHVPAYQQFPVDGSGPNAKIDMSDYQYDVSINGAGADQYNGRDDITPAEARMLGILPANIADPA